MLSRKQSETEKALLSLEPAKTSDKLQQRIHDDFFEIKPEKLKLAKPLIWFSAGSVLAASLTLLISAYFGQTEVPLLEAEFLEEAVLSVPHKGHDEFHRISVSSLLVGIEEGPIFIDEDGVPVRVTNLKYLDTEVYRRASDGREVTVESIREESSKTPSVSF